MTLALRYAARSHVGLLRTGNEDSGFAGPRVLAVADGMGGHAAGEVASAVAIASIATLDEDAPGADLLAALRAAAVDANDSLREMVEGDTRLAGMGTTLTALLFTAGRLGVLHIGDSRCYLLRDGQLHQITHDDTLVQTLVDEGRITQDEATVHPQRSLITRALDGREGVDFDLSMREVKVGDRYLLCTDGLTGPVGHGDSLLSGLSLPTPRDAVDRLVELALRGGGPDNISVVVADVVDGDPTGRPVVVGAAADSPQPPGHLPDSAAGRAAAGSQPLRRGTAHPMPAPEGSAGPQPGSDAEPGSDGEPTSPAPRRRRARRSGLLVLLATAALLLCAGAGWAYVRSQWYVGTDGSRVMVYRGVSGSVAGIELASVAERTDLDPSRLNELDRQGVQRGIPATGAADARRIVAALRQRLSGPCGAAGSSPTGTAQVDTPQVDTPQVGGSPGDCSPTSATGSPTPTAAPSPDSTGPP